MQASKNPFRNFVLNFTKYGMIFLLVAYSLSLLIDVFQVLGDHQADGFLKALFLAINPNSASNTDNLNASLRQGIFQGILAWGAISSYILTTIGGRLDYLLAKHMARNHIVIVAGRSRSSNKADLENTDAFNFSIELAKSLVKNDNVILVIPKALKGRAIELRSRGVIVIDGELSVTEILSAANVRKAKYFVALRDDTDENIALSFSALHLNITKLPKLEVKCLIPDSQRAMNFDASVYFTKNHLPNFRAFNLDDLTVRQLFNVYPPDELVANLDQDRVHILLFGGDQLSKSFLIYLSIMGHYRSGLKPLVTLVSPSATSLWSSLLKTHPTVGKWIEMRAVDLALDNNLVTHYQEWFETQYPYTAVYVFGANEITNLVVARSVINVLELQLRPQIFKNLKVIALDPPGGSVMLEFSQYGKHKDFFQTFSLLDNIKTREAEEEQSVSGMHWFFDYLDDDAAKTINWFFFKEINKDNDFVIDQTLSADQIEQEKNQSWNDSPEWFRISSRRSVDFFLVKLRALGYKLNKIQNDKTKIELDDGLWDRLGRMEHNSWMAFHEMAGWRQGVKSLAEKTHPSLVPFESLDLQEQTKDKKVTLAMIKYAQNKPFDFIL